MGKAGVVANIQNISAAAFYFEEIVSMLV